MLQHGSTVHMETTQGWHPALNTTQREEPHSYDIVTQSREKSTDATGVT